MKVSHSDSKGLGIKNLLGFFCTFIVLMAGIIFTAEQVTSMRDEHPSSEDVFERLEAHREKMLASGEIQPLARLTPSHASNESTRNPLFASNANGRDWRSASTAQKMTYSRYAASISETWIPDDFMFDALNEFYSHYDVWDRDLHETTAVLLTMAR